MSKRFQTTRWSLVLAAAREEDADQVATLLLEEQDTPVARSALIETALEAGEPRPQHLVWLDEAEAMGGEQLLALRGRLETALRER